MSESNSGCSSEQITRRIEELGKEEPWFHCIDLGNGIRTMQDTLPHLQRLWDHISRSVPGDLSGKSVLDIGCNAGFFSVQAKRSNANYVLGIDLSDGFLRQAAFVRDVLDLDIDYKKMSIFDVPSLGIKFDIVLCLGVIYHCPDPFSAARCIESITKHVAVVESAVVAYETAVNKPIWEFVFPGYNDASDAREANDRRFNWWFPNMKGLGTLFRSAGFTNVQTIYEDHDRGTIACYK
jgi:tRNA (mo5U34)-methyltransferase